MVQSILSKLIIIAFVVGGAVAGDMLKSSSSSDADDKTAAKTDKHAGSKDKHEEKKDKKQKDDHKSKKDKGHGKEKGTGKDKNKGHGKGGDYGSSGVDGNFFKFSRQFVIPVVESKRVQSLVILDINLELAPGLMEQAYQVQPKLRASVTRALLQLASDAAFDSHLTNPKTFNLLREHIQTAATDILGEGVKDVLIIDIVQQDQ